MSDLKRESLFVLMNVILGTLAVTAFLATLVYFFETTTLMKVGVLGAPILVLTLEFVVLWGVLTMRGSQASH